MVGRKISVVACAAVSPSAAYAKARGEKIAPAAVAIPSANIKIYENNFFIRFAQIKNKIFYSVYH